MARYLGPHDFGVFSYSLAFVAFFSWASQLGLNQIIVREIAKYPDKAEQILGSAFLMKLMGALLSVGLITLCISFIKTDDELIKLVVFIVSLTYVFQAFNVIEFFYQANILSKYTVIAKNAAFVISSAVKIYFIVAEYSVVYFAVANVLDMFLAAVFMVSIYIKTGYNINSWRFNKFIARELLKYSWPLMVSVFLVAIHLQIDQVMIEQYLGLEQTGLYGVAVRLSESWYFIPTIIVGTLFPYFVGLREKNKNLYQCRLIQLYFVMFWLGMGAGVVTQLFGENIIVILFGEIYRGSFEALVINIWAGIFVAQAMAKGIWDIAENMQFYRIISNSIAILINICGNVLLIPAYGITGAAVATIVSRMFNNLITPIFIKQYRHNTIISIKAINPLYVYRSMSIK